MKLTSPQGIIIVIVLCIAVGLATGYGVMQTQNETVAMVNGEEITQDQLYEEMVKTGGQPTLDKIIAQKVIALEMQKQEIVVSEEEIQNELNQFYEYYGGEEAFKETLTAAGLTLDDMKSDMVTNLGIMKLMESRITITEEEMQVYFGENKALLASGGENADYESNKEDIRKLLLQQKSEAEYEKWMAELYEQYGVVNQLESK